MSLYISVKGLAKIVENLYLVETSWQHALEKAAGVLDHKG